ncbi:hypothetical protein ACFV0A_33585, partial [Streptomyces sp. NPDC059552]
MNPRLLRLYPAAFRSAFGDEMVEAHRLATENAGPVTRLREAGDIVAHALRLRLGIASAQRGGRLFAAAAPHPAGPGAARPPRPPPAACESDPQPEPWPTQEVS